jgi:hypothetical protein
MDQWPLAIQHIITSLVPAIKVLRENAIRRERREGRFGSGYAKRVERGVSVARQAGVVPKGHSADAGEVPPFVIKPIVDPYHKETAYGVFSEFAEFAGDYLADQPDKLCVVVSGRLTIGGAIGS